MQAGRADADCSLLGMLVHMKDRRCHPLPNPCTKVEIIAIGVRKVAGVALCEVAVICGRCAASYRASLFRLETIDATPYDRVGAARCLLGMLGRRRLWSLVDSFRSKKECSTTNYKNAQAFPSE